MDFDLFEQSLLSSSLFTDLENSVDSIVDQLRNVVTSTLDKLAPLGTVDVLAGLIHNSFVFDGVHCGAQLTEFTVVTVEEVVKQLNTMPAKSSPMDFVPTSVLKRCKGVFAHLIARLANMSFSQGRFLAQFKLAQVLTKRLEWTSMIQQVSDPYPT